MKRRIFGADHSFLDKARLAANDARKQGYQPPVPWIHIQRRLYRDNQPNIKELAQEAIEKISHHDPEWGSFAYEQLSWVLPAAGFFQATLDFAKHMLDSPLHNFQDSDAVEELPCLYAAAGQFENALRLLSSLIQKDPHKPYFRMERSILYSHTSQFEYAARDIDSLADGRHRNQAQAFYYYWRDQPGRVREMHERNCAISNVHPHVLLYTYCMLGDFDAAMEQYAEAVNSLARGYIDFGPLRAFTRARLPAALVNQLEKHPAFASLLENEGIDDAWCNELMGKVNELAEITGIRISPKDDV
jgi:tetratricopeptide (TPR) repeat protein